MRLRLRTKITLIVATLVLAVVAVSSSLYVATLTRQMIRQMDSRANLVAQHVFFQAQNALVDAATSGQKPASGSQEDLRNYVRNALDENSALTSLIDAEVGYSPQVYEVSVVDRSGTVMISSDSSLPDRQAPQREPLSNVVNASFLRQLEIIYGPPKAYDVTFPFQLGPAGQQVPFGEIRVAAQTGLLRNDLTPTLLPLGFLALGSVIVSVLLAAVVANASLAPLGRISAQLDNISSGRFDQKPLERKDEFGQVSTKISEIGQQLRGVREIFSTLRENLDQVLGGLEDGLLLFTRDGRAVMVSPAAGKFLGQPADELLGKMAGEIFPVGHPIRDAVRLAGGYFEPVAAAEVDLPAVDPTQPARRIGVSVQSVDEGGTRMAALVTLRDLESIETIGRQLQLSERLSALGRVTAGVAHEVKNPLNSMRLWLENLKENLPAGDDLPRQAVAVLDSEIDRLDSVVKRFLDFMRPPELRLEDTRLDQLLDEIASIARPETDRAGIRVEKVYADLPPLRVDRHVLTQALLNLVLNSIQAMPNGGRLTLSTERHGEAADIRVQDTGHGIAPEHRARIFQLFFTTRPGGNGIGLASTYKAVQLHDGSIDFESEVGRGTTFRIELPLTRPIEPVFSRSRIPSAATSRAS